MKGKLIFVSGVAGSGKTTLVREALNRVDNLEPLLTYTTRPMRDQEEKSHEYLFVSDAKYEELKSQSRIWDETIYAGYRYGSDAAKYIEDLKRCKNVIVSVVPVIKIIDEMKTIYQTDVSTIWVDTDPKVAAKRIEDDRVRSNRTQSSDIKVNFDVIYAPTGLLDADSVTLAELIRSIISMK